MHVKYHSLLSAVSKSSQPSEVHVERFSTEVYLSHVVSLLKKNLFSVFACL